MAGFRGTLTYAPLACHRAEDMCRRDDLWSWLYMLVELATGKLAWHAAMREVSSFSLIFKERGSIENLLSFQVFELPFKVQVERIGAIKKELTLNPTEMMTGCAVEFLDLHTHIDSLGFYDKPNYDLMTSRLRAMLDRRRRPEKDGEKLDWEPGGKYFEKIIF